MERAELEATAKEAMQSMGVSGVISFLIDWSERCFYEEMAHGLMDEMTASQAAAASNITKVG